MTSAMFLQDPIDNRPFISVPSRLTIATWSFGSFLIVQIVTGTLRSNTAVKTPVKLLDTFKDVLDRPQLEVLAWEGTPTLTVLTERRGEPMRIISERVRHMGTSLTMDEILSEEKITKMFDGKAVFIQDPDSMLIDFPQFCGRYSL